MFVGQPTCYQALDSGVNLEWRQMHLLGESSMGHPFTLERDELQCPNGLSCERLASRRISHYAQAIVSTQSIQCMQSRTLVRRPSWSLKVSND